MRDPILGAILVQDEMIDRMAEQISKERGIKDPAEARRIKAIAYARSGNGIIDLLARKRDEIIDARIRAKEEAAHNFLVSQGWDGVDTEKAKEIADKFICEEHPDGAITFREKTEEEIASEELLPCPCCGGKPRIVKVKKYDAFQVVCSDCLIGTEVYPILEDAIRVWNRRPSPWHTGTPTEEGWYVTTDGNGEYDVAGWEKGAWAGYEWISPEDIVAWRKIEPYNP